MLDIDTHHGGTRPAWAVPTLEASTPSGGVHLHYLTDGHVRNSVGRIAPEVDVRGDGGMVLMPPSRTAAGEYSWTTDPAAPMALVPVRRFHDFAATSPDGRSSGATIIRKKPEDVRPGEVHQQVLSWAGWLAAQGCDEDEVTRIVWDIVHRFPFEVDNAGNHIDTAIAYVVQRQAKQEAVAA